MEKPKPIKPGFADTDLGETSAPRAENLSGLFPSEDVVPTEPARKLSEQIRNIAGVPYIYDAGTDSWIRLGGATIYVGIVAADGSAVSLPTGWTSAKNSIGSYTITHSLASTAWIALVSVNSNSLRIAQVGPDAPEANTLDVFTYRGDTLAQDDARFMFTLIPHSN